jgi:hypothetical protein
MRLMASLRPRVLSIVVPIVFPDHWTQFSGLPKALSRAPWLEASWHSNTVEKMGLQKVVFTQSDYAFELDFKLETGLKNCYFAKYD